MRACLGNWEFLSQTNDNAECVPQEDIFTFVDDLTTLEIINLLTVGLSSFFINQQVPQTFQYMDSLLRETNLSPRHI